MKLSVGQKAPNFEAPDQDGITHSLKEFRGSWLLLYFYPKDFTTGCITEACEFRDHFEDLSGHLTIVGVSRDSVVSHKKFKTKYKLPFLLLSDPDKKIIRDYGTDGVIFAKRTSFLINPDGFIEKIYEDVDPNNHAQEIIKDLHHEN